MNINSMSRGSILTLCIAAVAGYLLATVLVLGANYLVLRNAGEGLSVSASLKRQSQSGGLQSSAFDNVEMSPLIKLARYEQFKPDVIAIGTSRVTQLRPDAFTANFVNLGMSFTMERAPEIAATILKVHKPKLVLLGVDWFRLNGAFKQPDIGPLQGEWTRTLAERPHKIREWEEYRRDVLLRPSRWMARGKLSPGQYLAALIGKTSQIGVPALASGSGMGPRGSRYYGRTASRAAQDFMFKETLKDIRDRQQQFTPGNFVEHMRWRNYRRMVETFEAAGATVIPFMPPLANRTLDAMDAAGGYAIFGDLREHLLAYHGFVHDFTRPASVGSNDCEFVDGYHGGEVTYLRILLRLSEEHPQLASMVDIPKLKQRIARYAGRATAYDYVPGDRRRWHEADFLGLGCNKRPANVTAKTVATQPAKQSNFRMLVSSQASDD